MPKIMLNNREYSGGSSANIDIATTLTQDTVSDTSVPSSKAVYDELQNVDAKTLEGKSASDFLSVDGGNVNNSIEILENGDETLPRTIVTTTNDGTSYLVNRDENDVRRQIKIQSVDAEPDVNKALTFETSESGSWVGHTVLHSGNIDTMLGGIRFGVDENGNYGYIKAGADTVTPFRTAPTGDYSTYTYVSGTAGSHSTISLNVEWYSLYLVELQSGTEDTILSAMETLTGMEIKQTIQTGSTNYNNTKVKWYICEATSNVISITVVDGVAINLIKIE